MRYDGTSDNEANMSEAAPKDPLVLFMPSGKRGRFPVGTPVLDAARKLARQGVEQSGQFSNMYKQFLGAIPGS